MNRYKFKINFYLFLRVWKNHLTWNGGCRCQVAEVFSSWHARLSYIKWQLFPRPDRIQDRAIISLEKVIEPAESNLSAGVRWRRAEPQGLAPADESPSQESPGRHRWHPGIRKISNSPIYICHGVRISYL